MAGRFHRESAAQPGPELLLRIHVTESMSRFREEYPNSSNRLSRFALEIVLPDTYHGPIAVAKFAINDPITAAVTFDLPLPKSVVARQRLAAATASVPETAIYEYCDSFLQENEVRLAKDAVTSPPARNALRLEDRDEFQFGCLIAATAYPRHIVRASFGAVNVGHIWCLR